MQIVLRDSSGEGSAGSGDLKVALFPGEDLKRDLSKLRINWITVVLLSTVNALIE